MKSVLRRTIERSAVRIGFAVAVAAAGIPVQAAPLQLATYPLFLGGGVPPNIMFTLDDSGSMYWSYMPDGIANDYNGQVRGLAPERNWLAYNPHVDYSVPVNHLDIALPLPSFTAAWDDGYAYNRGGATCTVNLSTSYRPTWGYGNHCNTTLDYADEFHTQAAARASYYIYYTNHPTGPKPKPANCTAGDYTDNDCYIRVYVSGTGAAYLTVPNPAMGSADARANLAEEQQNFANWYSYYRKRTFAAKAGVGRAFSQLGTNVRVGFGRINRVPAGGTCNVTVDGFNSCTLEMGVRAFDTTPRSEFSGKSARQNWFDLLYRAPADGWTPLRRAADDVGRYFDRGSAATDTLGPWDESPGSSTTTSELRCRQSYHILMSDGYWNQDQAATANARANNDGSNGPTITHADGQQTYQYTAGAPFADNWSNTLADIAMYYWNRDLRTCTAQGCANDVPPNSRDPAFWQHLVTFTVGLGLDGGVINAATAFAEADKYDALKAWQSDPRPAGVPPPTGKGTAPPAPVAQPWPQPCTTCDGPNLDDMLHAAVNSHGGFLSARDPQTFANGLDAILTDIANRVGSAASVVLNMGTAQTNTRLYQARFQTVSGSWSGQLLAYSIDPVTGALSTNPLWDAGTILTGPPGNPLPGSRLIATHDGAQGVPFRVANLSATQLATLQNSLPTGYQTAAWRDRLVDYLRGVRTFEVQQGGSTGTPGIFRDRLVLLGDIVNSAPAYVGAPSAPYKYVSSWGTDAGGASAPETSYSTFVSNNASRTPLIYVGANDGMLHAFDAATGVEKFAFVPGTVFRYLGDLASTNYSHRYYVDGSPTVGDAFFANAWHTMLVSGLNGGGQGVFAINVTDPSTMTSEANVASKVRWEFTDVNTASSGGANGDADLGYTYSEPSIVRMNNGKWAAVFGNGYNSTEPDGSVGSGNAVLYIVDIETGRLISKLDTGTQADPLGSGRPNGLATVAPVDRDGDYKIDFIYAGDLFGNLWRFDVGGASSGWAVGNNGKPVFQARAGTAASTAQPITTRPQVVRHPLGKDGFIVLFGTGKYLEQGDHEPGSATAPQTTQSFYGIWDRIGTSGSTGTTILRTKLLPQVIYDEQNVVAGGTTTTFRLTTDRSMVWYLGTGVPTIDTTVASFDPNNAPCAATATGCYLGWRIDLLNTNGPDGPDADSLPGNDNWGERQVTDSVVRGGKIIFTTLIPTNDPCQFGGDGWLMELDAATGSRLSYTPFDVNKDGAFGLSDYLTTALNPDQSGSTQTPVSGRKSKVGIPTTPAIVARDAGRNEFKYESGSTGQVEVVYENPGPEDVGRQSWQQLFR